MALQFDLKDFEHFIAHLFEYTLWKILSLLENSNVLFIIERNAAGNYATIILTEHPGISASRLAGEMIR